MKNPQARSISKSAKHAVDSALADGGFRHDLITTPKRSTPFDAQEQYSQAWVASCAHETAKVSC
jgi:hypothetical protein